jgi:hypothetical protein
MKVIKKSLNEIVECHGLEGFKDPFWNLGQVLAWAETRSPFAADMLSDSGALSKRSHSMPPTMPQYAADWAAQCAEQYSYAQFASPFSDAKEIYLTALRHFQSGNLLAFRSEAGFAEPKPMSGTDWMNLEIGEDVYGEVVILSRGASRATYRDVRVERAAALKVFEPAPDNETKADPGNDHVTVYCAWIAQNIVQDKKPSRNECLAHMRETFPGIEESLVRALRRNHAPDAWKDKGRRVAKPA